MPTTSADSIRLAAIAQRAVLQYELSEMGKRWVSYFPFRFLDLCIFLSYADALQAAVTIQEEEPGEVDPEGFFAKIRCKQ